MALTRYRDFDLNFQPHPVTGDLVKKTDEDAIKQSLKNLIFLNFNEKPFHPEIGSGAYNLLFENVTPVTAINIKKAIEQVIQNYEPRAELIDVRVLGSGETHSYDITITFMIINIETPVQFSFVLRAIR